MRCSSSSEARPRPRRSPLAKERVPCQRLLTQAYRGTGLFSLFDSNGRSPRRHASGIMKICKPSGSPPQRSSDVSHSRLDAANLARVPPAQAHRGRALP
ncbi:hypothetical protein C8Q78DRAFT_833845 [Trametes maxima]|nr:hypothetical protein C8Q78DRAFT_833845 [Trametes maxima]